MANESVVYLHKVNVNKETGAVSVIVTDEPLTSQSAGKGFKIGNTTYVSTSRKQQVTFGVLVLKNPKTGKLLKSNANHVKLLQAKPQGFKIPNMEFSENPVLARDTKQPTGMMWVVDAE